VPARSRVHLPAYVPERYEVYVNGVPQRAGEDFEVDGRTLVFERDLRREGRLGFWRWFWIAIGVVGVYRQNDAVDVVYETGGRRQVAHALPIDRTEE
jgi:hypothetical protein